MMFQKLMMPITRGMMISLLVCYIDKFTRLYTDAQYKWKYYDKSRFPNHWQISLDSVTVYYSKKKSI